MRRPQLTNSDGSPNYQSSHLVEHKPNNIYFDIGLLVGIGNGEIYTIGTAFFIGQDYAVTAWHVIEELIERLHPGGTRNIQDRARRSPSIENEFEFELEIHVLRKSRRRPIPLSVTYTSRPLIANADIALLKITRVNQPNLGSARIPLLHIAPPPIGTAIDAFAFITDHPQTLYTENQKGQIDCSFWWSHGVLKEHLWEGRGSTLPFPIFESNASFPGGMSGGPVVSESGVVFGIVCYDMGPYLDNPDADPVSYICSLLPVVGCKTRHDFQDGRGEIETTVKELADRGVIHLGGIERIELFRDDDGNIDGLRIKPI